MHSTPTAKIEYDLTKTNKQKNLQSTCSFQKKKKLTTFYHFSRLYLYFTDFFRVWKIARQISRLFKEFKTLGEPWSDLFRTVIHNNNPGQNSWDTH